MKTVPMTPAYFEETVKVYKEAYSEGADREWDAKTAKSYLQRDLDAFPQYCLAATDQNNVFLGSIFCKIDPYYQDSLLFIDSLQVASPHRNQGVGKALINRVVDLARENGFKGVHMLADGRKGFPRSWYEQMGFVPTGWIEYEVDMDHLRL